MTNPLPNWDIWLHMPKLTTHQAVCLSFGLDPSKVHAYDSRGKAWGRTESRMFHSISGFEDRLTLFSACHRGGLSVLELSKWTQSVGWNIPIELASLAPIPIEVPEALPAETVRAALMGLVANAADIDKLQNEITRLGIAFTMRDGVETVEIPNGMVSGLRGPLSNLYGLLSNAKLKDRKLDNYIRALVNSGGGALGGGVHGATYFSEKQVQTMAVAATQLSAPNTDTAKPKPVVAASVVIHSTKARRDTLTPVIEFAQTQCINPQDTAEVWGKLQVMANDKHPPFLRTADGGLDYLYRDTVKVFTRDALGKRLVR